MKSRRALFVAALCLPALLAAECGRNPARPRVSHEEIRAPAYDRFFERFGAEPVNRDGETVLRRGSGIVYTIDTPTGAQFVGAKGGAGAYKALAHVPGADGMAMMISFNADPSTDPPAMQLHLLARKDLDEGGFIGVNGDPVVLCNLSHDQAIWILDHGIPESLMAEMVRAALDAEWQPSTASPHRYDRILFVSPEEHLRVDGKPE